MKGKKKHANNKPDSKPDSKTESIKAFIGKTQNDKKNVEEALRPLKRINSLPSVYEFVPVAKTRHPDSKSIDFDCDGASSIPNQSVYKTRLPDNMSPGTAFGVPGSVSFTQGEIGRDDKKMLKKLSKQDSKHFLKTRVGMKNLEKIDATPHFQSIHEDIKSRRDRTVGVASVRQTQKMKKQKRASLKILIIVLSLAILVGAPIGTVVAGIHVPGVSEFIQSLTLLKHLLMPPPPDATMDFNSGLAFGDDDYDQDFDYYTREMTDKFFFLRGYFTKLKDVDLKMPGHNKSPPAEERRMIDGVLTRAFQQIGFTNVTFMTEFAVSYRTGTWWVNELKTATYRFLSNDLYKNVPQWHHIYHIRGIMDDLLPVFFGWFRTNSIRHYPIKSNLGLMKWYGYEKGHVFVHEMSRLLVDMVHQLEEGTLTEYFMAADELFHGVTSSYYENTEIKRPPVHIRDEYGNCAGSSVCPSR